MRKGFEYSFSRDDTSYLVELMKTLGIVDIGYICDFNIDTGKASVQSYQVVGGQRHLLRDVEVLFIGNNANGFQHAVDGSPCLIIYPRSVVPTTRDNKIMTTAGSFEAYGAKCIPLSNKTRTDIRMGFDGVGNFFINGADYTVTIDKDGMIFRNSDNTLQYSLTGANGMDKTEGGISHEDTSPDGEINIYYEDTQGIVQYRMNYKPDGTYTIQRCAHVAWTPAQKDDPDQFTDYTWETVFTSDGTKTVTQKASADEVILHTETYNTDGSREFVQFDADGNPIRKDEISADGTRTFTHTDSDGNVLWTDTFNADGSRSFVQQSSGGDTLNTITIDADGNISIESAGTITTKATGAVEHASEDAMSLSAKGATLDAGDGKLALLNGQYSVKDAFNDLITVLDAFKTQGSPAAHTAVPGQFTQLQQNLANLF